MRFPIVIYPFKENYSCLKTITDHIRQFCKTQLDSFLYNEFNEAMAWIPSMSWPK